jgi:lipoyl(octanoyl) transferase
MSMRELPPELWICHLGTVPYREATAMQQTIRARRWASELPDVMLLLEHPPTYTCGRRAAVGELPMGEPYYRRRGIEILRTDRGGRVTYHGPGQLVGYPIMAVSDVVAHVRRIETALVAALADEGIGAHSRAAEGPDFTGVWVGERKIASIGVHVSRGVTTHGFAINVENDLEPFSWIVPCGLQGVSMTSIARERARARSHPDEGDRLAKRDRDQGHSVATPRSSRSLRERVGARFCETADRRARIVSPLELGIAPAGDVVAGRASAADADELAAVRRA